MFLFCFIDMEENVGRTRRGKTTKAHASARKEAEALGPSKRGRGCGHGTR
jgi:hypothetical protein